MATPAHTIHAVLTAIVPAPDSDVARLRASAGRLKALHDEAVVAVCADRGEISRTAWARAREMATATGEGVRACLGRAMREAWAAARAIVSAGPAGEDATALASDSLPAPAPLPSLTAGAGARQGSWPEALSARPRSFLMSKEPA